MSSNSPSSPPEDQDSPPPNSPPPMANSKSKRKDSPSSPPSVVSPPSDPPARSPPSSNDHNSPPSESPETSPAKEPPSKSPPPPKAPKASPPPEQNSAPPPSEQNSAPPPASPQSPPPASPQSPPPASPQSTPPPVQSSSPPPPSPPPPAPSLSPPASLRPSNSSPSSNSSSSADTPPRSSPPPATQSPAPPSPIFSPPSRSPPPASLVPPRNPSTSNASGNRPRTSGSASDGGVNIRTVVAIASVLGFLLLALFLIALGLLWRRTKKTPVHRGGHVMPTAIGSSPESDSSFRKVQKSTPGSGSRNGIVYSPREPGGLGNSKSWLTYEELVEATDGFSAHNLLGEGGFGRVYKGSLADGRVVAVKQLKIGGGQGDREFRSEVEIISRIHHRHLVSLVGYSIYENGRLLVYDYVPNNNLYFHLHGEGRPVLDWAMRVKIAVGAARGIAYLHEDCRPRVIHRDIKSSNILLDNNFEARVSDFGLAKLAMDMDTHITTRVMGTFGYMAPEYASSGKLTEKSDVFSYGVVLLELLTGRKPVDASQPLGEESLVEWARPSLNHALETLDFGGFADPRLEGCYVGAEMFRMIEAAAACVRHSSTKRPTMGQVLRVFDSMVNSDLTNGMRVGESELFDPAQQSGDIKWFRKMAFGSQDENTDLFSRNWSSDQVNQESGRKE